MLAGGASTLARIPDQRVTQFGDPNHLVARKLNRRATAKPPQTEPACCVTRGFFWDDVILYAPHTQWNNDPPSAFWDGPVVRAIPGLENAFTNVAGAL
jgi:hypothetical protein